MKVVFCAHDSAGYLSGPNAWIKRLLPSLAHRGIQVKVLFLVVKGEIEKCSTLQFFLNIDSIECVYIHKKDFPYLEQQIRWMIKEANAFKPSIFVPNLSIPAYYACKWLKKANIRCIGVLHSYDEFHMGIIEQFINRSDAYAIDGLACVSSFIKEIAQQKSRKAVDIRKIPCGVPVPPVEKKVINESQKLRIMYGGRLVEEAKQISLLTKAFCEVTKRVPDVEAFIYGDGPMREQVISIINNHSDTLSVSYKGKVDSEDMQKVMKENDVIVLLSDYEGLPVSMMEAMSWGLVPVGLVLDQRSGIGELIQHEKNGLIVKDREDSFYKAIDNLISDKKLLKKLSEAARETIATSYSNDVCTDLWIDFFKDLSSNREIKDLRTPKFIFLPTTNKKIARAENRRMDIKRSNRILLSKIKKIYSYLNG